MYAGKHWQAAALKSDLICRSGHSRSNAWLFGRGCKLRNRLQNKRRLTRKKTNWISFELFQRGSRATWVTNYRVSFEEPLLDNQGSPRGRSSWTVLLASRLYRKCGSGFSPAFARAYLASESNDHGWPFFQRRLKLGEHAIYGAYPRHQRNSFCLRWLPLWKTYVKCVVMVSSEARLVVLRLSLQWLSVFALSRLLSSCFDRDS
jgi:hypothetical protein